MDRGTYPDDLSSALASLNQELIEGDITHQGFMKRRTQLLAASGFAAYLDFDETEAQPRKLLTADEPSETHTSSGGASSPPLSNRTDDDQSDSFDSHEGKTSVDRSRHLESSQNLSPASSSRNFLDQAEPLGRISHEDTGNMTFMYEQARHGLSQYHDMAAETFSPALSGRAPASDREHTRALKIPPHSSSPSPGEEASQLLPLEPRGLPFAIQDPHNETIGMSKFDNVAAVLRHRGKSNPRKAAFMVLDIKGKELATITWDKLASRSEKVAQVIRDKSGLYRGDRVALVYRESEVIDYAIALFGCFIAGVVAVPINKQDDFGELTSILAATQAHLALTTDTNLKAFHRELSAQKLSWPRGVEWWKTNEFGSFHPKKKDDAPPLQAPDLAYIEYSRSPTGELRGVVISHRTVMHQMACISAMISISPGSSRGSTSHPGTNNVGYRPRSSGEVLVTYLDPRQAIGMIMGVLMAVYHGNTTVWCSSQAVATPGLFAHIITRYRATILLADYPGLKTVAYNYQNDPMSTRGKKYNVDFSSIKLCLVDCLTVDTEFHEILADRWLRPLGNKRAREVLTPMLCLPEHGGMVIAMKDWLEGQERIIDSGVQLNDPTADISEVLLDREALKANEIVIVATGDDVIRRASDTNTVRVGSFWYPIADATLAIVDPETSNLAPSDSIGEIWIDSPSMSACYWLLPRHTDTIFHARPYVTDVQTQESQIFEQEFLRTGLLGFVVHGKVFVLGLYEDRLRQKVEYIEDFQEYVEYRYHYVAHLVNTVMRQVHSIFDCSAFDVYINKEHLPIVLLESPCALTTPMTPSGPARILDNDLLESLATKVIDALLELHQVRVYCVLICAPNTLPRVSRNGRKEIGNMLCRKEFESGNLPSVLVKFAVERAVLDLPVGEDTSGGIWSSSASESRELALRQTERQITGIDARDVIIDERSSMNLSDFGSVVELFHWRASRLNEELALCTIDSRGKEGKGVSWKKLDLKIASVASLLRGKYRLRAGTPVILMFTLSEDFFYAVHACLCLGITAIPIAPLDPNRLNEDVPALLSMISDYGVKIILVNNETHHALSAKTISQHLKQSAIAAKVTLPQILSTSKSAKQTKGCRELGFVMDPVWAQSGYPALVWTYWSPDHRRTCVQLDHQTLMKCCKVQKETCQMSSSRPILGCVRSTSGLGFIHSCLLGMYVGCTTYYLSPVDYAANPLLFLQTLARYKIKDTYVTPQTMDFMMSSVSAKNSNLGLHEMKNTMLSFESRPGLGYYSRLKSHFKSVGLDSSAINAIYGQVVNPFISARSYTCIEPIELYLDSRALREGYIQLTNPKEDPFGLVVQDSGMVPVCTRVAIVNPESCQLCRNGEFGEIWVASEACVNGSYKSLDAFDAQRFHGKLRDIDDGTTYVRTGDLGFLYTISRKLGPVPGIAKVQTLFVLGNIGETFEVSGLTHFPIDIETTIERSHRVIARGGSAVFQAGEQVIVLVEVLRTTHLSSIVPVIVNTILDEHQLIVDKVAFCARGDFPRSRLYEKQRGKILASWITRRLKTCIVFNVRDGDVSHMDSEFTSPLKPVLEASNESHS